MKRIILLVLALIPALSNAAALDLFMNQRDANNTNTLTRQITHPAGTADGVFGYIGSSQLPGFLTIGPGLTLSNGVLDAGQSSAPTWASITGKPAFATVATSGLYSDLAGSPALFSGAYADLTGKPALFSGAYADLSGKPSLFSGNYADLTGKPTLFNGAYASLTGIPATFAPAAHTQAFSTITATPTTLAGYGITDAATASSLAGYATTGALSSGLAGKFNTPAGTTAQYIRGDGSLATLPVARRIEVYSGTTNASGQVVVTYPTAYPVTPIVQPPAPALANQVWTTVSSTTTGFTLQLNQRNTVTLLSIEVLLGATVPVNGAAALFLVVAQ